MLPIRNFPHLRLRKELFEAPSEPALLFGATLIMKPLLRWDDFLFVFVLLAANPDLGTKDFALALSPSCSKFGASDSARTTMEY